VTQNLEPVTQNHEENKSMIEKTTHVPIVVSDQNQALTFYTEMLGFEKRADYQQRMSQTSWNFGRSWG